MRGGLCIAVILAALPSVQALRERAEWESGLMPHRDSPQWETRVVEQAFWPGQVVFRVDCGCGGAGGILPVIVAVDKSGKEALALSNSDGSLQRTEEVRFNRVIAPWWPPV